MTEAIHLHPLVFTLRDTVTGCGFLAGITVYGKAVMEQDENGEWWMYGVCPGALAGGGATTKEAFQNFRNRYKEVLFDIAEECGNFLSFKRTVEEFFNAEDSAEKERWDHALAVVRRNNSEIPEAFKDMPRKEAKGYDVGIYIERLEKKKEKDFSPTYNIQDSLSKVA